MNLWGPQRNTSDPKIDVQLPVEANPLFRKAITGTL
jgi:hypothetical protein